MTRWLKKKYTITFSDGTTFERDLTEKQFRESEAVAKRIGATVIPVLQEAQR